MLTVLVPILGNVLLWLWVAAAVALWLLTRGDRRRRAAALVLLIAAWLLACRPVAGWLLRPFEGRYARPPATSLAAQGVRQVVVLTGGGFPAAADLASSAMTDASAQRFLAGLELCARLGRGCRLILSGSAGRGSNDLATADSMAELARRVAPDLEVRSEGRSESTAEHPRNVLPLLEDAAPFALVTSAYHMPRAMRTFERAGLEPIAFPVDLVPTADRRWTSWLPTTEGLKLLQAAWRESLAWALYSLRGW